MTTIAAVYDKPSNTFSLAADGRATDTVANCVKSDSIQKVFPLQNAKMVIGYSITGFVENDEGTLNIKDEAHKLMHRLAKRTFDSGEEFAKKFSVEMLSLLKDALGDGRLHDIPTTNSAWFVKFYLLGFYRSQPFWIDVSFSQGPDSLELSKKIVSYDLSNTVAKMNGSSKIAAIFKGDDLKAIDPRFENYVKAAQDDARSFAINLVKACVDPAAVEFDPECKATGGHIHAVEITRNGFNWHIPPVELVI